MAFIAVHSQNWHHIDMLRHLFAPISVQGASQPEELCRHLQATKEHRILAVIDVELGEKGQRSLISTLQQLKKTMTILFTFPVAENFGSEQGELTLMFTPWKTLRTPEITTSLSRSLKGTPHHKLVGSSLIMEKLREEIAIASRSNLPVHIYGETGTGKEIIAHMIHQALHPDGPDMVIANCSDFSDPLARCKLFGTRRGAFTDAKEDTQGLVEIANGSTLFLDELEDLSPGVQSLLLRLIEYGTYQRVGDAVTRYARFHVLTASNVPLPMLRMTGKLRNDLFYRLNGFPVKAPPLRTHREDIPALVEHFLQMTGEERPVEAKGLVLLRQRFWSGNVRELFSSLKQAVARSQGCSVIRIDPEVFSGDEQPFLPFSS
jgi:DNA-binding NtrC family response regulator